MLFQNFNETVNAAMNNAAETSRDKGLLENALTMTSFSMPSQADVIDYEITLLTEKQNQIYQHIEELASEAVERLAELNAERAEIIAEMEHYKQQYSDALLNRHYWERVYGKNCIQYEKAANQFRFAGEMYDKANQRKAAIGFDILEMEVLTSDLRDWLTGNSPSVVTTTTDDLPFETESAKVISREAFDRVLAGLDVTAKVEYFAQVDFETAVADLKSGSKNAKTKILDAVESVVWESEDLDDATKEAFTAAMETYFKTIEENLEEKVSEANLPSQRRINANIGYVRA